MFELLIRLAAIIMASAAISLIFYLASLVQKQRQDYNSAARRLERRRKNRRIEVDSPRRPYRPAPSTRRSPASATYKTKPVVNFPRVRSAHQDLEKQLLSMLGGNRATAIRLLKHTYQNHLDQGYQWCLEKTISDLLRDRRS